MNRTLLRSIPLMGLLALATGCLSTPTIAPTQYYTLNVETRVTGGTPTSKTLGIRPLASARPYKLEIAYTAEPNRLSYFPRAEWAEAPSIVINRALKDSIRALGAFVDVGDAADMVRPDYILTGELRRFEADYTGTEPRVVVEVALAIRSTSGPGTLWEGLANAEAPLPPNDSSTEHVAAVAQAMSEAVSMLIERVCGHLAP